MIVGTATVEIFLPGSGSLKAKRGIIKPLLERVRRKFNVSAAEVGCLDKWQRSTLGIGIISNEVRFADQVLAKVIRELEAARTFEVIDVRIEMR